MYLLKNCYFLNTATYDPVIKCLISALPNVIQIFFRCEILWTNNFILL